MILRHLNQKVLWSIVLGFLFSLGITWGQTPSLAALYYEDPEVLVSEHTRFPQALRIGNRIYLVYQRIIAAEGSANGTIQVEYQSSIDGLSWSSPSPIGPPVAFRGESPPPIFSFIRTENGRGTVALAEDGTTIRVYELINPDQNSGFTPLGFVRSEKTLVSPTIVARPDGGYFLFVTQDVDGRPSLVYSSSLTGGQWSSLTPFGGDERIILTFNPSYSYHRGEHVVTFQGVLPGLSNFYQIFIRRSTDGAEWSLPTQVTTLSDEVDRNLESSDYDNQRPRILSFPQGLFMTWERRTQTRNIQIYGTFLTPEGEVSNFPEPISNRGLGAGNPQVYNFQNIPLVTYFDNPSGSSRFFTALRRPTGWQYRVLSNPGGVHTFGSLVIDGTQRIHAFWQQRVSQQAGTSRIFYRLPDQQVDPPRLSPLNYVLGQRSNQDQIRYLIQPPADPSGIQGFAFSWSQERSRQPDQSRLTPLGNNQLTVPAVRDGEWYFAVQVLDGAGNWSRVETLTYFFDSTPPIPVVFRYPTLDESGFLGSNTFSLQWLPSDDPDLGGYAVALRFLGTQDRDLPASAPGLPEGFGQSVQVGSSIARQNFDNGLWGLTVSAVDRVGNVSNPNTLYFRLNKYIPVTRVSSARALENILGQIQLTFLGRGFTANGTIDEIVLDQDGQEPWDYRFIGGQDYRIASDTSISDLLIRDIRTGTYQILFSHTERGVYRVPSPLDLQDTGTVRFGDFTIYDPLKISLYSPGIVGRIIDNTFGYWTTMVLLLLTMILSAVRLVQVVQDGRELRFQARAIMYQLPRHGAARRVQMLRRQGISLGIKITVLIILLVSSVIALIALPLRTYFLTSQQETLSRGLEERVGVLIESMASGAVNILPTVETSTIELSQLILQSQVMEEAEFATISAITQIEGIPQERVWATTDPLLLGTSQAPADIDELNAFYFERALEGEYIAGVYSLEDPVSNLIPELQAQIDREAREKVGDIPDRLNNLLTEAVSLVFDTSNEAIIRRREIDSTIRGLNEQLDRILRDVAGPVRSVPTFVAESYNPAQSYYLFYKPVVFRGARAQAEDARYYQGMVRMGISTQIINEQIALTTQVIQNNIIIFSLIALAAGVAGAALLSLITILPIRKLVKGVETIRDTEDKVELKDFRIGIRSRDELFVLSDVIQQMASNLAKGAEKDKELLFGKDVQKMFISLDVGANNLKQTTGHIESEYSEFFGYYEGAKGVSGDYFYYQKITADTYAIVKCDISGKGISAALIMVEVATLFLNYFSGWEAKQQQRLRVAKALKESINSEKILTELVYNINDLIAERQFSGKFAALTIALFNEQTGDLTYCNAGDNLVNTFRKDQGKLVQTRLFASPASGMFNSKDFPVEFKEEKDKLKPGDVLLLYTDGMEESKRHYRSADGSDYRVTQKDIDDGMVAEGTLPETDSEELGPDRVNDIINALENREVYTLPKYFAPFEPDPLVFDFTEIVNTPENTVLGIVAVEKIFRLNPDPKAGPLDRVMIDKKVDDFLKNTFQNYMKYFHTPLDEDPKSLYRVYSGIREDEQYDDLTILAVKKK